MMKLAEYFKEFLGNTVNLNSQEGGRKSPFDSASV